MYFDNFAAIVTMDGHGGFVWSAYLITVLVVILMLAVPVRRRRRVVRELQGQFRREEVLQTREESQ